tara:strand:- start:125 stop:637 length:513 start_codon:yes stop_codon:yes gene_type:complete
MNDLIINKGTVQSHLQVANGVDKKNFKRFIFEAQYMDLRELTGEVFYNDLVSNYSSDIYQTLMQGGVYTYNENSYHFEGIEKVLSYFAYGRFIVESSVQSSSFGMVKKNSENSDRVSLRELEALGDKHSDRAILIFNGVKDFLDRNKETYILWGKGNHTNNLKTSIELWG